MKSMHIGNTIYWVCDTILFSNLSPTEVAGSATDAQPVVDSTGTQIAIIGVAVIGWLIVLGMILIVIVLFYRHKKKIPSVSYCLCKIC